MTLTTDQAKDLKEVWQHERTNNGEAYSFIPTQYDGASDRRHNMVLAGMMRHARHGYRTTPAGREACLNYLLTH